MVNPVYRDLDGKVRSQVGKLDRMMANFGAMHFEGTLDDEKINPFMQQKEELNEAVTSRINLGLPSRPISGETDGTKWQKSPF